MPHADSRALGIYVHWPFCEAICPYCDFNVRIAREIDEHQWGDAFRRSIRAWTPFADGRAVGSVYFGGGTPSLMPSGVVNRILTEIDAVWGLAADAEISLEANPTSVEIARFRDFAAAGVNRLSVGLQALEDDALLQLGRRHSAEEGRRALSTAGEVFDRVSFDLIYGRPHQTLAAWESELRDALSLCGEHCSLYQLTIEAGTPFAHRVRHGRLTGLPDEDQAAAFFELTNAICSSKNLVRYEISNHARDGGQSRHNCLYWLAQDWIGVGPGAHGRLTLADQRLGTIEAHDPLAWLSAAGSNPLADDRIERLSSEECAEEVLFGGLRLRDGFDLAEMRRWHHAPRAGRLDGLIADGVVHQNGDRLRATQDGTLLIDAIVAALVPLEPL
ncbi:MAG: radical SAM family heme chaperone HemW [Pseudomonadota bacterium]